MSRYEIIDIPTYTNEDREYLNKLQRESDGRLTLGNRQEMLALQYLEAAADAKASGDYENAVKLFERYKKLSK